MAKLDQETEKRIRDAVDETLGDLRWNLDVSREDCEPDQARWDAVKTELRQLMADAYLRNHETA